MIKVIIVDDESRAIDTLANLLSGNPDIAILKKITDPENVVATVRELHPDLLFMDVQMPVKDGFEVVRDLDENALQPEVIFVTGFNEYAIKAIRCSAFDFLVKPVDPAELHSALVRFKETVLNRDLTKKYQSLLSTIPPHGKIKFATGSGFILLNPEDIIYILADWNYSEVFLSDEKKELITTNLGTLQKFLPCSTFYRIDRSTIINLAYLTRVNRKKRMILLIKDGKEFSFNVPLLNIRKMERLLEGTGKH